MKFLWAVLAALSLAAACQGRRIAEQNDSTEFEETMESLDNLLNTLSEIKEESDDGFVHSEVKSPGPGVVEIDEEEASVEDEFVEFEFKENNPTEESPAQDRSSIGGDNLFILETEDTDTLQDIFNRERMPRISKILSSGDAEKIDKLIAETKKDPFAILPQEVKYHELLGADLFFAFVTRLMLYFVFVSLALPALIPILEILLVIIEEVILWGLGDTPEV